MTTMSEELWCKAGSHFWHREATRGRKPIACPEHRDVTPPKEATPRGLSDEQQRVAIEAWGAIPRMPYVRDEVIRLVGLGHYSSPASLYQALGNFLQKRETSTEHPVPHDPPVGGQSTTVEVEVEKVPTAKVPAKAQSYDLADLIKRLQPDFETRLKLEFIDKRLKDQVAGRIYREQADINSLMKTQREIVRQLERRAPAKST